MFTLGTSEGREIACKKASAYIPVTIFVMLLGFVYELFGHGVYSPFMVYAFVFPLVFGLVFWYLMSRVQKEVVINSLFVNSWTAMLFTFMMGFLYKGVLDIYGTYAKLSLVYWIVGGVLFMVSVIAINIK